MLIIHATRLLIDICYSSLSLIRKITFISLVLIGEFVFLLPLASGSDGRSVERSLFGFFNFLMHVNPAVICVTAYVFSDLVYESRPDSTSLLSIVGLASQILIHIILPISWLGLLRIPYKTFLSFSLMGLVACYQLFIWALVDNAIFAVLQGWLLRMALKERKAMATHRMEKALP
jgi:hypothetical protein